MSFLSGFQQGQPAAPIALRFRLSLACAMFILTATACATSPVPASPPPTGTIHSTLGTTPSPVLAPTITPLPPTVTGAPNPVPPEPPWDAYASPEVTPASTLIPTPVDRLAVPSAEVNILLFGSDWGPDRESYRTDATVLLSLNPNGSVSMTSFPRDLYVYIPGWRMQRLNAAQPWGGFETTQETFAYNFGVRPDYFVTVNLEGFQSVVDSLGGVDVNIDKFFYDARDGYPKGFTVYPGVVHMDGETALWYVRARETTGDLDRERRIEEVLLAIGRGLLNANGLARVPELYNIYQADVSTDITLEVAMQLLPLLQKTNPERVHRYTIGLDQISQWTEPLSGAYYFIPKPGAIQQTLQQALNAP
jgi:LCP family protein required for cell wall assembly